jgi:hypothetical protein
VITAFAYAIFSFSLTYLAIVLWGAYVKPRLARHSHRCPCGSTWTHTDASIGNVAAHTCKKCGTEVWWRHE